MNDLQQMPADWASWDERFRWHLDLVPLLLETMRAQRVPVAAARYDRELVTGSRADGPPSPARLEVIDDADALWRSLREFEAVVSRWLEGERADRYGAEVVERMAARADRAESSPRGEMASAMTEEAVRHRGFEITDWLLEQSAAIEARPELQQAGGELLALIRKLARRYLGGASRRTRRRECRTCGAHEVVVEWAESIAPGQVRGSAVCLACRQLYVEVP